MLTAFLVLSGCGEFHFSARELTISPDPAVPGDDVTATFFLTLIPAQSHTIIVIIDDTEHIRVSSSDAPSIPVIIELGDAADLIGLYGTGDHRAHVVVHANDDATRTQSVAFRLNEPSPGE